MTAKYKLVRNPNPDRSKDSQSLPLHPRLISCGTISTEELIDTAKEQSSFSPADMKGVLQLLQDVMAEYLKAGYNVELKGIGIFSVSLEGKSTIMNDKVRSESICFKNVNFRAAKELKERLKTMTVFKGQDKANEQAALSLEECKQSVLEFLVSSPYLTQKDYAKLCKCSTSKASIDLRKFVEYGWLSRKRIGTMYLYYKENEDERVSKISEIIH